MSDGEERGAVRLLPGGAHLLDQAGDEALLWVGLTRTRVDVGLWFRRRAVLAGLTATRLLLAADGPRPFFHAIDHAYLRASLFNQVSGRLLLAPGDGGPVDSLLVNSVIGDWLAGWLSGQHRRPAPELST